MRKITLCIAVMYSTVSWGQSVNLITEYRHDILDTEETESDFYRFKGIVSGSENTHAYAAAAWIPADKRKTYTFAFCAADSFLPLAVTGGDYYVRFGSGLLIGHGRPYNPDPFRREESYTEESGIKPCTNGSQSSAFRGFGFSRKITEELSATAFGSRALRYYTGGDSSSSIGSLLSHPDKDDKNTEPVYLKSGGMMVSSRRNFFITQLSGFYADLTTPSGERILWAAQHDNEGYRSTSGGSLYAGYNDGVVSVYADYALSSSGYIRNGRQIRMYGKAFQGEALITKDSFRLRCAAKHIGEEYYSPFFSPIGSKTPSNSFFCETDFFPYKSFSIAWDAAVEQKNAVTNFDPEPSSTCREGLSVVIKPIQYISLTAGHRLTGNALESFPERQQFKGGLKFDFRGYDQVEFCFTEQRKSGSISRVFECKTGIDIARIITIGTNYAEIRAKKDDGVFLSPLPLDGVMVPWISVNGQARLASMKISASWKGITLRGRGLYLWTGKTILHRRFEFAAEGSW